MKSEIFIDKRCIMQVLGNIKNNPNILLRTDKYELQPEDFGDEFHILIFGILQNLKAQGLKTIGLIDIDNYLSVRPGAKSIYDKYNGAEYVVQISKLADEEKFDYYYERLKKLTLLRMYNEHGIDISWLYNPDTLDIKLKQKQEDWLDRVTRIDIVNAVEEKINRIRTKYSFEENTGQQAGYNIFELIENNKKNPEIGVPLYGNLLNTITKGARLKKFYLRSAPTGVGKAIPNYLEIPTPDGIKKVGDIRVGDTLFDAFGHPTKVLQVFPQKSKKRIWELTLADGRTAPCCSEHLWEVKLNNRVVTTHNTLSLALMFRRGHKLSIRRNDNATYDKYNETLEYLEQHIELFKINKKLQIYVEDTIENNDFIECLFALGIPMKKVEDKLIINRKARQLDVLFKNKQLKELFADYYIGSEYDNWIDIVGFEQTDFYADMTCFRVDNEFHLFLMNDYIVTHNTRMMVGDVCNLACNRIYNIEKQQWEDNGASQKTLYITTEQEIDEIQTLMLSFVSGVDEDHIIEGKYGLYEEERVLEAARIIQNSPLWIEELPDFSLDDIENLMRRHIEENDVTMIFFDYIHTSLKIMEEITRKAGGIKLREDQILLMLAIRLKDLANQFGVFVMSSTQLSSNWETADVANQNLLRGRFCALTHLILFY